MKTIVSSIEDMNLINIMDIDYRSIVGYYDVKTRMIYQLKKLLRDYYAFVPIVTIVQDKSTDPEIRDNYCEYGYCIPVKSAIKEGKDVKLFQDKNEFLQFISDHMHLMFDHIPADI